MEPLPGVVFHQGRYIDLDTPGLQQVILLPDDSGDVGPGCLRKPGSQPLDDFSYRGVLLGVSHETSLGRGRGAVNLSTGPSTDS